MELEHLCERIRELCREVTATDSEARLQEILRELLALLDQLIDALKITDAPRRRGPAAAGRLCIAPPG